MLILMGCVGLKQIKKTALRMLIGGVIALTIFALLLYMPLTFEKSVTLWGHVGACLWQFGLASVGLLFCLWTLMRTIQHGVAQYRLVGLKRLPIGMLVGHIGICVMTLGLIFSSAFSTEDQVIMHTGEQTTLHGYTWSLKETYGVVGPNYRGVGALVGVRQQGAEEEIIVHPEKRIYTISQQIMTDADIAPGFWRDIFVSLGEPQDAETWSIRLAVKPLIRWIWIGGLIIALGGVLGCLSSLLQQRQREPLSYV
jgi:cytochrome c-type biogenesis protein CcmF